MGRDDVIECELLPGRRQSVRDIFVRQVSADAVAGEVTDEWRDEGWQEGIELGIAKVARNLLRAGMEIAVVAEMTELSQKQIQVIQQQLAQE